jgi:hypothetical protein
MRVQGWWRIGSAAVLAAVLAGVTLPASAQVTSEKRIPVKKESGGDVARRDSIARADSMRRDSLAMVQARYDSLARAEAAYRDSVARAEQALRDSIARAELARAEQARLDSIARADSIRNAAALAAASAAAIPPALSRRGIYIGLAGGWSTPTGDLDGPYSDGWNVTVPFGWQKATSRFGLRADIAYDSHGGATYTGTSVPPVVNPNQTVPHSNFELNDNSIWSGNLDLTLDVFQWGANKLGALYLLGGIGVHFFDSPKVTITPVAGTPAPTTVEGDSQTEFGFNGGGGIQFGVGRGALFLESRYFTADTPNVTAQWVPVIIGLRWY